MTCPSWHETCLYNWVCNRKRMRGRKPKRNPSLPADLLVWGTPVSGSLSLEFSISPPRRKKHCMLSKKRCRLGAGPCPTSASAAERKSQYAAALPQVRLLTCSVPGPVAAGRLGNQPALHQFAKERCSTSSRPRWNTTQDHRGVLNEHTSKLQLVAQTHSGNFSHQQAISTRVRAAQPRCGLHKRIWASSTTRAGIWPMWDPTICCPGTTQGILVQDGDGERHLHQRHVHGVPQGTAFHHRRAACRR